MTSPESAVPDSRFAGASVTVVSVAYSSMEVLPDMARSLPEWVKLLVVDNGPDDGLRDWLGQHGHQLIVPQRNLGFGAGCNLGARHCNTEFVFFLNPDACLTEDCIKTLLRAAENYPKASAFGPEFIRADGKSYSYRPSRILNRKNRFVPPSRPNRTLEVPSLNGAGLFCRRHAYEAVGGFDENIFLFFEDDDLTMRLSARVGPLYYVPEAKAYHGLGASSPASDEIARLKGYNYSWSNAYVLKKHGRRFYRSIPFLGALRRFLSVKTMKSRSGRQYAIGRLAGAFFAVREL